MADFPGTAAPWPELGPICRLGLASRGDTHLTADDVRHAIDRGVDFLNWCARPDGLSEAVASLDAATRDRIVIATQLDARDGPGAIAELEDQLRTLGTDRIDLVTYYWVEHDGELDTILGDGGAHQALRKDPRVRHIGITSHQRPLARRAAVSGEMDALMIRYNAAHRGAEHELFGVAADTKTPIVAYTCTRWGKLMEPTRDDPVGFVVPRAPDWYRWVLANDAVAIAIMAPNDRAELDEDLAILDDDGPPDAQTMARLAEHGKRVYKNAKAFP